MPNPAETTTAQTLNTLAGRCYFSGRNQMNLARDVERVCETIASPYGSDEKKATESESLTEQLARLITAIEEQAARLPELRRLSPGSGSPNRSPVEDLGSSVVVRYKPCTDRRGAGWIATLWRDRETTFRASSHFTYETKDNDGADTAAAKCLAKFAAYCNDLPDLTDLPKVTFRVAGRVSLGNGSYAYTYTRTR